VTDFSISVLRDVHAASGEDPDYVSTSHLLSLRAMAEELNLSAMAAIPGDDNIFSFCY
jgi:hypothetical protein